MTTLTLSGWAQPADALAHLADDARVFDFSDYASPETAIAALSNIPHTRCIAWSMGGTLALAAIAAGAIAPRHLTLIGAPYQFVQSADYRAAMDPLTYQRFHDNYQRDPARTKERFLALIAKGDREATRVMRALRHHQDVENTDRWLPWLQHLGTAQAMFANASPTLIIHGAADAIVPAAQGETLAALLPQAQLSLWQGVGHAPHVHDAARLRREIAAHQKAHGV